MSHGFEADIVWMHEQPLEPGRQVDIRLAGRSVAGQVVEVLHQVDVNTLERHPAERLELNVIARCRVGLTAEVPLVESLRSLATVSSMSIARLSNVTLVTGRT